MAGDNACCQRGRLTGRPRFVAIFVFLLLAVYAPGCYNIGVDSKQQTKRIKRNRMADLAAALVLFCLVFFVLRTGIVYFRYLALDFATVEPGVYDNLIAADMLTIRSEYLITAPAAGVFVPGVEAGDRVGEGAVIGVMQGEQSGSTRPYEQPVTASHSGIVSFELDGWEESLTQANLESSDLLYLMQSAAEEAVPATSDDGIDSIASGRPVAKVIDNLVDTHLLLISQASFADIAEKQQISLRFTTERGEISLSAKPYEQGELSDSSSYLLATVDGNEETLLNCRYAQVSVVGDSVQGLTIPRSALTADAAGNPGVYRAGLKELMFVPVSVVLELEDEAFVEGLTTGDRIVANPAHAAAGQRIYH